MTDEELESIPLLDCPSCDSHNTVVKMADKMTERGGGIQ